MIPASLWPSSCVMPRRMARRFPALAIVYTSRYDPRAAIARKYLEKIMEREDTQKLPSDERALFAVATELEDIALNDEYFVSRNLYPNVDFYTGFDLSGDRLRSGHVHHAVRAGPHSPVGLRSTVRCWPTRIPRSAAHARSTPVRSSAISCRWTSGDCWFEKALRWRFQ